MKKLELLIFFGSWFHCFVANMYRFIFSESARCLDDECGAWEATGCHVCWIGMLCRNCVCAFVELSKSCLNVAG
jgi:hypothetical protein